MEGTPAPDLKESKPSDGFQWWLLVVLLAGSFLAWLVFRWLDDAEYKGAEALFAALAFGPLVYAIFLQQRELSLQREELRLQREELAGQKEEMRLQRGELAGQRQALLGQIEALNRSTRYRVLFDLVAAYKTPEMYQAVARLWEFYRLYPDPGRLTDFYLQTKKSDMVALDALPLERKADATRGSLHYQRWIVSKFYFLLAGVHYLDVIPSDLMYLFWSKSDLEVVPKLLIPIETALAKELGHDPQSLQLLTRLYGDAPDPAPRPTSSSPPPSSSAAR